jgi:hypothetical protein
MAPLAPGLPKSTTKTEFRSIIPLDQKFSFYFTRYFCILSGGLVLGFTNPYFKHTRRKEMKNVLLVFGVLVLLVAAVACKKEEPVAPTEATEATDSSMQNTMEEAVETTTEAGQAVEEGKPVVDEAAEAGQTTTEETTETPATEVPAK